MVNLFKMRQLIRDTVKLQWRVEKERAELTRITSVLTGMPHGTGNHSKIENGVIRVTELNDAYKEVKDELERMRVELEPLICTLENADDRAAMRLRYIKGFSPEDIAEAIHRTSRSIYYYLSRAEDQLVRQYPDKVKANG